MELSNAEFTELVALTGQVLTSLTELGRFLSDNELHDAPHLLFRDAPLGAVMRDALEYVREHGRLATHVRALRRQYPGRADVQGFAARHLPGAESALASLLPLLDQARHGFDADLVHQCVEQARPHESDPPDAGLADSPVEAACYLAAFPPGADGVYPVQHFVRLLASDATAGVRTALEDWLENSIQLLCPGVAGHEVRTRLAAASGAALPHDPVPAALLVRVRPDTSGRFIVDAWLFPPGRPTERIGATVTVGESEVPATVIDLCGEASLRTVHGRILVEVMLPRQLIIQPVEYWARDGDFELCADFEVVVRPLERWSAGPIHLRRLATHWRTIDASTRCRITSQLPPPADETAWWLAGGTCDRETARVVSMTHSLVCGVLAEAPGAEARRGDAYQAMLAAGIPVIMWLRSCPDGQGCEQLRDVINEHHLRRLSQRIHELRTEGLNVPEWHPGQQVTLVWDDPTREPPQHEMRNPGDE
ncbi:MAG: hypothetical protein KDA21_07575 [Phycisphaerales bacterium]|nr:hypothetical protein [Phycisphaerales bacterium]